MRSKILLCGAIAAAFLFGPQGTRAQDLRLQIEGIVRDYLAAHPEEVGELAREYFAKHPEALTAIVADALKARSAPVAGVVAVPSSGARPRNETAALIASNAAVLFSSPHQVTLGNRDGDVTLVEFFDYSCGFCKRAVPDMLTLLKDDPKLKIVLKEFPILGPGSVDAAHVAIAVRMQDPNGTRYLAFHEALFGGDGPASKEKALAVAGAQGFDMARLNHDMASDEVANTLAETMHLSESLGIRGTPGYVVGDTIIPGAIGVAALEAQIATARRRTN
jgi:protein-disulfide isomerase